MDVNWQFNFLMCYSHWLLEKQVLPRWLPVVCVGCWLPLDEERAVIALVASILPWLPVIFHVSLQISSTY